MVKRSAINRTNLNNPSDYSLQLNRWYLKPIGAWPSSRSTSRIDRIISIVLIVVCYCSISFTVIPAILHIVFENEDIEKKLRVLGPLSHWFVGGINYTMLLMRSEEIRCCVEHLETDWRIVKKAEDQQVMLKNAKLGRYVAGFCAAFMQGSVMSYCLVTALATDIVRDGNETRTIHLMPCAFYRKVLNVERSPMNEIVLVSQFLSGFIVNSSAVAAFSFAAVFAAHACGQLNVLMNWITEFVNESGKRPKETYGNEIGIMVEHHLRVLSLISRIENVMNRICFSEMFKCTLNICMLGYYILTEWAYRDFQNLTTYFLIMISMTFNMFIICYIGEVLTEQCKKVGEVVYMTNWYYLPGKTVLDLLLIIARSSAAIKITAGKLIHISIYTFGDMMKSAFAYLNLLRQRT
ncbi:odorant receptor 2a-like [Ptiloglossa arizonensis]|uniref:odorant receptor 2a-like n=1 Tax=Ptiloglossa arizonensis TaxID=3350558 RepID=UPI003FA148F7